MSHRKVQDLQRETERRRLDLIRTDLDMCRTLVGIAESELALNNHEHAGETFARVSKGYADSRHLFEQRNLWEEQPTNEIAEKLAELRQMLTRLQQLVQPH